MKKVRETKLIYAMDQNKNALLTDRTYNKRTMIKWYTATVWTRNREKHEPRDTNWCNCNSRNSATRLYCDHGSNIAEEFFDVILNTNLEGVSGREKKKKKNGDSSKQEFSRVLLTKSSPRNFYKGMTTQREQWRRS